MLRGITSGLHKQRAVIAGGIVIAVVALTGLFVLWNAGRVPDIVIPLNNEVTLHLTEIQTHDHPTYGRPSRTLYFASLVANMIPHRWQNASIARLAWTYRHERSKSLYGKTLPALPHVDPDKIIMHFQANFPEGWVSSIGIDPACSRIDTIMEGRGIQWARIVYNDGVTSSPKIKCKSSANTTNGRFADLFAEVRLPFHLLPGQKNFELQFFKIVNGKEVLTAAFPMKRPM
jgi:hypothetical protein